VKLSSESTTSDNGNDYKPVAGDVVELTATLSGKTKKCRGLVFTQCVTSTVLNIWTDFHNNATWGDLRHGHKYYSLVKIGSVDSTKAGSYNSAKKAFEAYLSAPTFTGSYAERQKQWIEHFKIEIGSKVRMIRPCRVDEDGSNCSHHSQDELDDAGSTAEITSFQERNVNISNEISGCWSVPYFALEPVSI
jgi:hypothetical protein